MKQQILKCIVFVMALMTFSFTSRGQADEIQQLILDYQKLAQLRKILKNMYQGYEILTKGYNTVKGLSEGNFKVHDVFLSALLQVSPAVRNYKRIADIIAAETDIVNEYGKTVKKFRDDSNLSVDEIKYIIRVSENILKGSAKNIDALMLVITANKLRMSDDERLREIDRIYDDTIDKRTFLRHFSSEVNLLSLQRKRAANQLETERKLYDIK